VPGPPQRIAILRFENLSAPAAPDWMGRGFSEVIAAELAKAPGVYIVSATRIRLSDRSLGPRPVSVPGISTELPAAIATGADLLGYGTYWIANGKLEARLVVQDASRMKEARVYSASAAPGDLLGAATALGRQVSPAAGRYGTSSEQAVMGYAQAIESTDAAAAEAQASLAIGADPDFAAPYIVVAELKAAQDRAGAQALLERALARSSIPPDGRARLQIAAARLNGQPAALEQSQAELARLEPGDADNWKSLAGTAYARRDFRQAMAAWQKALAVEPADVEGLNQLAYSAAYAGDLPAATAALHRYQALRPRDANALDSLGDVNLIDGHLKEAEEFYLQAAKKDPNFYGGADWYKAAMSRLMTGDVAGADALARQFADARSAAHDPAVPIFQAHWQWLSGRRKEAYRALEQVAQTPSPVASVAYTQMAVWSLMAGDRAAAEQMSTKAMTQANRASAVETLVVRFLSQPQASAAEWQKRAEVFMPNPAQQTLRDTILAYALLFSGEFAPASEVLRRLYDSAPAGNGNEGLPVLLAWCYLETGRENDAAPLLEFNPVPAIAGPGVFTAVYFPRIFELRARLDQKLGHPQQAQANAEIFAKLAPR
jgi:tetratricopeptide (TPR) repeat protein